MMTGTTVMTGSDLLLLQGVSALLTVILLHSHKRRMIPPLIVVLCVPIAGFALVFFYELVVSIAHLRQGNHPMWEDVAEPEVRSTALDTDIIPLQDAFLVQDEKQKRRFFTEAIKQSVVENPDILQQAMHDHDREVAYYAVSMVTDQLESLVQQIFTLEQAMQEQPPTEETLRAYAKLLRQYLSKKAFIDPITGSEKLAAYMRVLHQLIACEPENMNHYLEAARSLMEVQAYRDAEELAAEFLARFPEREEPYRLAIEIAVAKHEPEKVHDTLQRMKALPIALSADALHTIRYWDRRGPHE